MPFRTPLIWAALALTVAVPLIVAATSPLLQWRGPVYIAAGFAGILAMGLLLVQPLLASGALPGPSRWTLRRAHRWTGAALVALVIVHVAGLWITSPPDVIDALTFTSPTPFSAWGVIAMWALFAAATLAALRKKLRPSLWRRVHTALVGAVIAGSVVHALLIQGTMGTVSKVLLCLIVLTAAAGPVSAPWRRSRPAASAPSKR